MDFLTDFMEGVRDFRVVAYPSMVHLTTAYLTHHTLTSPLLTLNVNLTDLVYCVDNVNKVSVLSLVHLSVNNAPMSIY